MPRRVASVAGDDGGRASTKALRPSATRRAADDRHKQESASWLHRPSPGAFHKMPTRLTVNSCTPGAGHGRKVFSMLERWRMMMPTGMLAAKARLDRATTSPPDTSSVPGCRCARCAGNFADDQLRLSLRGGRRSPCDADDGAGTAGAGPARPVKAGLSWRDQAEELGR